MELCLFACRGKDSDSLAVLHLVIVEMSGQWLLVWVFTGTVFVDNISVCVFTAGCTSSGLTFSGVLIFALVMC